MLNQNEFDDGIKICSIALGAYPLLAVKNSKSVIGPDVHQILLAKELLKYNFKITFITYDEGGAPVEYINGIQLIKMHEDVYRSKILNVVLKVFRIWIAMRKAKAHIYFYVGGTLGVFSPFVS